MLRIMTNEMSGAQSELTNIPSSPKLEVRSIYMPDLGQESTKSSTTVLERPSEVVRSSVQRARGITEAARRARETGERPPQIGGGAPRQASSRDLKEEVRRVALTINPDEFDNSQIKDMANTIKIGDKLSRGMLVDFKDIAKAIVARDPNVDLSQAVTFTQFVDQLVHVVDISQGTVREIPEEVQAKYFRDEFLPNTVREKAKLDRKHADGTITPEEERQRRELEITINNFPSEQEQRLVELVTKLDLQGGSLDESTIELIVEFPSNRPLKYLINRLVSLPLNYELGRYDLGFYGKNNLDALKTYLQTRTTSAEVLPEERERADKNYRTLLVVANAIEFFHGMNSLIVQGNLEGFVRAAENITPEQLQVMQGVFGASFAMRLLDQEYELLLSRDGWINNDNYGKMMGFVIVDQINPETGEHEGRIVDNYEGSVFEKFKQHVGEAKVAKDNAERLIREATARGDNGEIERLQREYGFALKNELADMADWEVSWAFNVGKILHNLSLRPAEYISQGENPEGAEQYASFPQENMARLMNWMNEMMLRFQVAEARGGVKLSEFVQENYQKIKETDGYYEPRISKIMGKDLDFFELPAVFEVSGPMSSWRQTLMILRQIKFVKDTLPEDIRVKHKLKVEMQTGEELTLGHLIDGKLIKFKDKKDKDKDTKLGDMPDKFQARFLRTIFLKPDGTLRDDINTALGVLLKNGALNPSDDPEARKKNPELEWVKRQIRQAIWRRAAQDNPLAVLPYLNGMEFTEDNLLPEDLKKLLPKDKKGRVIRKIEIIDKKTGKAKFKDENGRDIEIDYEKFHRTLSRVHEFRMRRIKNMGTSAGYKGLEDFITDLKTNRFLSKEEWDDNREGKLIDYIRKIGEAAAGEFAEVRFNFNPFMNDVLFEQMVYGKAGAEYYRRRAAGDLGSLSKAENAYIAIANNPAGLSIEDFGKHIIEIVDGIGSPLSTETGQRKAVPIEEAWIEFGSRGNNDWDKVGIGPFRLDLKKKRTIYFTEKRFSYERVHKVVNSAPVRIFRGYGPVHWTLNKANVLNSWAQHYSGDPKGHAWSVANKEEIIHHLAEVGATGHRWALYLRKRFSGKWRWKLLLFLFTNILPIGLIAGGVDLGRRPFTEGDEFKS